MENRMENTFEVCLDKELHIVTADTAFYKFLGERLYYTFDMIVAKEDREFFLSKITGKKLDESFIVHISDEEGMFHEMASCLVEWGKDGNVIIRLEELDSLYHENNLLKNDVEDYLALLSQFHSIYFVYEKVTDTIICFKMEPEKRVLLDASLDEAKEKVCANLSEEESSKADKVMLDFRNGARNFCYSIVENGVIFKDGNKEVEICGTAIYQNGVHIRTVGNISKPGSNAVRDNVRRDQLTGLILKEDITNIAKNQIDVLKNPTTIAIIDIDDFKSVNDNYGHMKGDEVLRKCAAVIHNQVGGLGNTGRIGGDEFFVVIDGTDDKEELRGLFRSIKNSILSAYSKEEDGFSISTSIGCASSPSDTDNFEDLFALADYMLYRAKNKGKNRYIMYMPEKHGTVEEILNEGMDNIGISSRKGMSKSEVICKIADHVLHKEDYPLESVFNDIVDYFGVERIVLYSLEDNSVLHQCGNKLMKEDVIAVTSNYIVDESLKKMYDNGVLVINNIKKLENTAHDVYEKLKKQGVLSFMHHEFIGKNNKKYLISYESVAIRNTWNSEDMHFFRILDHILARCV